MEKEQHFDKQVKYAETFLGQRIHELTQDNMQLREELKGAEMKMLALLKDNERLNVLLQQRLKEVEFLRKKTEEQDALHQAQLSRLREEAMERMRMAIEMEVGNTLKIKDSEILALSEQINIERTLRVDRREVDKDFANYRRTIQELETTVAMLAKENEKLKIFIETLKREVETLRSKVLESSMAHQRSAERLRSQYESMGQQNFGEDLVRAKQQYASELIQVEQDLRSVQMQTHGYRQEMEILRSENSKRRSLALLQKDPAERLGEMMRDFVSLKSEKIK
jgi:hypothetical protein